MGPYARKNFSVERSIERSTEFACVGTHFFVRFRAPRVKLDHFCAMQKKFRRALDGARRPLDEYTLDERSRVARPERSTTCSLASVVYSGDILQFAPGDNCASSLPLGQRASTPQKNPWPNFGGLNYVQFLFQVKGCRT